MTEERIVIVYEEKTGYNMNEIKFSYAETEKEALGKIHSINNKPDENVQRIFKFDEYGNLTHLQLKLEKFKLKLVPEE